MSSDIWEHEPRIFKARRIVTMGRSDVEAIATLGDRIVAAGAYEDLVSRFPRSNCTDFGNATVVPGFNDAHMHLAHGADAMIQVDVSSQAVRSIDEIKGKISQEAMKKSPGEWIRGSRYDDGKVADRRRLHRRDLDAAAPDHPVVVTHVAGHWGVVNSAALKAAGIDDQSSPPAGGEYGRDADGTLNGVLYEQAFFDFAYPGVSSTGTSTAPEFSFGERVAGLERAITAFHGAGLTSVCDALVGPHDVRLFIEGQRRGSLTLRVNMLVAAEHYDALKGLGLVGAIGDDHLKICGIKTFVDGAIGGRTCFLEEPFEGSTDDYGIQTRSSEELRDTVREAHTNGTRVCVHANGDRAIKLILGIFEDVRKEGSGYLPEDRIEHCTIVTEDIVKRLKNANITAVPFASYVDYHGAKLIDWYGEKRLERMFAHRWFLDAGVGIGGSSDYPCGPFEPLLGIQSCVTRTGYDGAPIGLSQKLTSREALWLYTVGSATACGEQHWKGRLIPGYVADFVVLEEDLLEVAPQQIAHIPIRETWVGAQRVWSNNEIALH